MVNFENKLHYDVYDLKKIIELLRAPGGCPWDMEQTHKSIRRNLLEEAYEAAEAIDENNTQLLQEELGDVLMQVIFHSDIEEKAGRFNLDDAADAACRKLLYRHPHVFGSADAKDAAVIENWDALKRREKNHQTTADAMAAVSRSLPSLWRAEKILQKAAKASTEPPKINAVLEKLIADAKDLSSAVLTDTKTKESLGDLLMSVVSVARICEIDPEAALSAACDKFTDDYRATELY